jgi:NADPH-dependent 7-cyano-7-deazaguanine reductase QueF
MPWFFNPGMVIQFFGVAKVSKKQSTFSYIFTFNDKRGGVYELMTNKIRSTIKTFIIPVKCKLVAG